MSKPFKVNDADDHIAENYVRLAYAFEAHIPGYIDGYFGPPEWATVEQRHAEVLRAEVDDFAEQVAALADESRRRFLKAQVQAMKTTARLLCGEAVPYVEEVRGLYDVEPQKVDEARLGAALRALDDLLPGEGDLLARELPLRAKVEVSLDRLPKLADVILAELRRRTGELFGLPEGERFDLELVRNKPWGGYNWPLGNLRSRIDINTDLPVYLTNLPALLAHEGYPGHHTEHAWKEELLVRRAGRLEHAMMLINAPECAVSEGIAESALGVVIPEDELRAWLTGELAGLAGADGGAAGLLLDIGRVKQALSGVNGNAALMLHGEGKAEAEVLDYLQHYGLRTRQQAEKNLEFIKHPLSRSYLFTYTAGAALLKPLLQGEDRVQVFGRLLTEPVTPGEIRAWVTEHEAARA